MIVRRSGREGEETLLHQLPPGADYLFGQGDLFAGGLQGLFDNERKTGTTGHFHYRGGDALDPGRFENIGKLGDILLDIIKLGTAHHDYFAFQKIPVKIGIGQRRTVGHHQQIGPL